MSEFRYVIGLEVHVQCCDPNQAVFVAVASNLDYHPIRQPVRYAWGCRVLPVMNRKAFDLALRAALRLNCSIASYTKWDRKNYYYPDLPKNYQISQYDLPFSFEGSWRFPQPRNSPRKGWDHSSPPGGGRGQIDA